MIDMRYKNRSNITYGPVRCWMESWGQSAKNQPLNQLNFTVASLERDILTISQKERILTQTFSN